ncbi:MAG: hypothetical protein ABSB82_23450 [Terriglobia bacterium]|jgi:hypothetical protein
MPLEKEVEYFRQHKDEWLLHHEGKYALVRGEELIGTFTKEEEAYEEGVKHFGAGPFLIKPILKVEPPEQIPAFFLGLSNARLS